MNKTKVKLTTSGSYIDRYSVGKKVWSEFNIYDIAQVIKYDDSSFVIDLGNSYYRRVNSSDDLKDLLLVEDYPDLDDWSRNFRGLYDEFFKDIHLPGLNIDGARRHLSNIWLSGARLSDLYARRILLLRARTDMLAFVGTYHKIYDQLEVRGIPVIDRRLKFPESSYPNFGKKFSYGD